ncbi:MAG: GNAT family N-acetyltransferase [Gammaproteobacteria bacterium]|nr:GNAT family N-acetyltransferase [Gammaproteobacteria bacterium]
MAGVNPPRPLRASDDRSDFDCGREALNHWLRRHAQGNEKAFASRTYVLTATDTGQIIGYVNLTAGQIERTVLAKSQQRNLPGPVPILLLGQLAIDKRHQGRGYRADLLRHALRVAVKATEVIAFVGLITHPLDRYAGEFYLRYGFQQLPGDTKGALILRTKALLQGVGTS